MDVSNQFSLSNEEPFSLITGPCVTESEEMVVETARELKRITDDHRIDLLFKSSFDKANRSSIRSYRGPGLERGLDILQRSLIFTSLSRPLGSLTSSTFSRYPRFSHDRPICSLRPERRAFQST